MVRFSLLTSLNAPATLIWIYTTWPETILTWTMKTLTFSPSAKKSKSTLQIWIGRVGVMNFGKMQKFWSC